MEAPYCVESCPTKALVLIDSEDISRGILKSLKKGSLTGLNFVSSKGFRK